MYFITHPFSNQSRAAYIYVILNYFECAFQNIILGQERNGGFVLCLFNALYKSQIWVNEDFDKYSHSTNS